MANQDIGAVLKAIEGTVRDLLNQGIADNGMVAHCLVRIAVDMTVDNAIVNYGKRDPDAAIKTLMNSMPATAKKRVEDHNSGKLTLPIA